MSKNPTVKKWLKQPGFEALAIGLLITTLQLTIALRIAPALQLKESYSLLCQWDCRWYEGIARDGYHSTIPPTAQNPALSNVAFFPAYPYFARVLHLGLHTNPRLTLLFIAQLFAVVFWAALWRVIKDWKISRALGALVVLGILSHPAAFMLVMGYSESLFLACMLLFLRKSSSPGGTGKFHAAGAGFLMSATRIVGVVVALYPLMSSSLKRNTRRLQAGIIAGAAVGGAAVFLLYCKIRFGQFDLYMQTQKIGWGIVPDYTALFDRNSLHYRFRLDQLTLSYSLIAFLLFTILESTLWIFSKSVGLSKRLPIYVTALSIFYISISGLKSVGFQSLIRYSLPWHLLLVLCLGHLLSRPPFTRISPNLLKSAALLLASGLIALWVRLQLPYMSDFLHGRWFA
ncbi:MAG: hypothetical protein A2Z97_01385 [Bdellovibrionales bacterium GWB1_52_6]|nr:MAG: hypothetical protein A2Z97_01385 [Bdellovibrionales bacterium GWB1_52_6]OFZ04986.1 MAG: hypothetical protein A2X97_00095 [Bdellovibrionales bacterium GWA1_52_35]